MRIKGLAFTLIALALLGAGRAWALGDTSTIKFGNTNRDIGNKGPNVEAGYQYTAVGASWSLEDQYSADGCALMTFWGIPPAVGNTTTFIRLDGAPFFFRSLNLEGRLQGQRNDVVVVRGLFQNDTVASQTFQSSNMTWSTVPASAAFAAPIDTLEFKLTESNSSALFFDNVVLQAVPEPAAGSILAIGVWVFASCRRAGNRRKAFL
jgi:hypothetical protein